MTKREAAYAKRQLELIARAGKLNQAEVKRVMQLLEAARTEVAARIAATDWQAHHIPQLRAAVEDAISRFQTQYQSEFSRAAANAWKAGVDLVDGPLRYVGIAAHAPAISTSALEILQGYSADLITGLGRDAIKQINGQIAMGIMGQKTPHQVMQMLGTSLTDKGVFRNIAVRAEAITRTELAHVNSMAREARIQAMVEDDPEVKWLKEWIASGKAHPRPNHEALNGVQVPVDMDFSMYGGQSPVEPGSGIPYPHAPGLPAAEVVNCGCSHVLTRDDWGHMAKDWQPLPYQEEAIYD